MTKLQSMRERVHQVIVGIASGQFTPKEAEQHVDALLAAARAEERERTLQQFEEMRREVCAIIYSDKYPLPPQGLIVGAALTPTNPPNTQV